MAIIKKNMILDASITDSKHLVNKKYVDDLINSKIITPVKYASITDQAGTYNSTGKTFTSSINGVITLDGVAGAVNDRVLLKNQTTKTQNGIYVVTTAGSTGVPYVLTRASDFTGVIPNNIMIHVMEGNTNAGTSWMVTNSGVITIDTTDLTFQKFPATVASGGTVNKYTESITGDGVLTSVSVNHNLNTQDITFNIIDNTFNVIYGGISNMSNNTIVLSFDTPLESGKTYKITIIG